MVTTLFGLLVLGMEQRNVIYFKLIDMRKA